MDNSEPGSKNEEGQDVTSSKKLSVVGEDDSEVNETENPLLRSVRYLEQHRVIRLFQNLAAEVVYKRPENPLEFIAKKLEASTESNRTQGEDEKDYATGNFPLDS